MRFEARGYAETMEKSDIVAILREKYAALKPVMDERTRRLWAATEAKTIGRGGQTAVARATGMSRLTIASGLRELQQAAQGMPTPAGGCGAPAGGGNRSQCTTRHW